MIRKTIFAIAAVAAVGAKASITTTATASAEAFLSRPWWIATAAGSGFRTAAVTS